VTKPKRTDKTFMVIFGQHDQATIDQIVRCAKNGEYSVLCADGHKGYAQPIGGVVAYKNHISVSGVGFDIACGNLAVRTDADPDLPKHGWSDGLRRLSPFSRPPLRNDIRLVGTYTDSRDRRRSLLPNARPVTQNQK
jgi:hypothetical protein